MDSSYFTRLTGKQPIDFQLESECKETPAATKKRGLAASSLYRSILDLPGRKRKQAKQAPTLQTAIDNVSSYYCNECKTPVSVACRVDHLTSLQHQLSGKSHLPAPFVSYPMSDANKGYKLLRNEGWTHGRGLGVEEDGRRLPIATVFKKDKLGIGNKAAKRKITHSTLDIDLTAARSATTSFQEAIDSNAKEEKRRQSMLSYLNSS